MEPDACWHTLLPTSADQPHILAPLCHLQGSAGLWSTFHLLWRLQTLLEVGDCSLCSPAMHMNITCPDISARNGQRGAGFRVEGDQACLYEHAVCCMLGTMLMISTMHADGTDCMLHRLKVSSLSLVCLPLHRATWHPFTAVWREAPTCPAAGAGHVGRITYDVTDCPASLRPASAAWTGFLMSSSSTDGASAALPDGQQRGPAGLLTGDAVPEPEPCPQALAQPAPELWGPQR